MAAAEAERKSKVCKGDCAGFYVTTLQETAKSYGEAQAIERVIGHKLTSLAQARARAHAHQACVTPQQAYLACKCSSGKWIGCTALSRIYSAAQWLKMLHSKDLILAGKKLGPSDPPAPPGMIPTKLGAEKVKRLKEQDPLWYDSAYYPDDSKQVTDNVTHVVHAWLDSGLCEYYDGTCGYGSEESSTGSTGGAGAPPDGSTSSACSAQSCSGKAVGGTDLRRVELPPLNLPPQPPIVPGSDSKPDPQKYREWERFRDAVIAQAKSKALTSLTQANADMIDIATENASANAAAAASAGCGKICVCTDFGLGDISDPTWSLINGTELPETVTHPLTGVSHENPPFARRTSVWFLKCQVTVSIEGGRCVRNK